MAFIITIISSLLNLTFQHISSYLNTILTLPLLCTPQPGKTFRLDTKPQAWKLEKKLAYLTHDLLIH